MSYTIPDVKNKHYEAYFESMPSQAGKLFAITGACSPTHTPVTQ